MNPLFLLIAGASAHQPHDPTDLLAVSPGFGNDGFVLISRLPNQVWRATDLVASSDGGVTFHYAYRGIEHGGSLVDVAMSPRFETDGVALLTTDAGAWLTEDGAVTWSNVMPERPLGRADVVLDGNALVLLVASASGNGWRSTDRGASWQPMPLMGAPNALASFGATVVAASRDTLYVSEDAGATFIPVSMGEPVLDVAVGDDVIVVGTLTGLLVGEPGEPLLRSPAFTTAVHTVGVAPDWQTNHTIFAAEEVIGPWVSTDGGASFVIRDAGLTPSDQESGRHFYSFGFSGDYTRDGTAFTNTFEGLTVSRDFGATWHELDTRPPGLVTSIALSPEYTVDHTLLVASADAGMWVSNDDGDHWTITNDDLSLSSIYDVAMVTGPFGLKEAVLAQNGKMAWGVPPYEGWELRPLPAPVDYTTRIALSPSWGSDGLGVLGSRYFGLLRTADRGETWDVVFPGSTASTAIAWGPDGTTVLATTNMGRIDRSLDSGATWEEVAPLDRNGAAWIDSDAEGFLLGTAGGLYTSVDGMSFAPVADFDHVIHLVSTTPDGTRYAAVRGGGLYRSDAGGPYIEIGTALTALGCPYELGVSPSFATDGTLFAALDERVFRSRDRGDSWTEVTPTRIRYEEDAQVLQPFRTLFSNRVPSEGASVTKFSLIAPDSFLAFEFSGTGIAWIAPRDPELGEADVWVDGAVVGHVSLTGAVAAQVEVFRWDGLPWGTHLLELRPTSALPIAVDAIDLFRTREPEPVDTGLEDTGTTTPEPHTGLTGDTGTTTPPTPTDDGGEHTGTVDDDGGKCGCQSGPPAGGILALAGALVLVRRRPTAAQ